MRDNGYHYEYIIFYYDWIIIFKKDLTRIFRGLNTLLPLKRVGYPEFYLVGDMVTQEINGETTHAFLSLTYIKNMNEQIENIFDTTIKNYVSPLEGGYH